MYIVEIQTKFCEIMDVSISHTSLVDFLMVLENSDPVKAYKVIDSSEGIIQDLKYRFNLGQMSKHKTQFDWT